MKTISSKAVLVSFCAGLSLFAAYEFGPREARTQGAAATAERKSITALTAAELMSLRRGVARMMARNNAPRSSADFRRSWVYWADIHQHFGADCAGPITGSGMAGVHTFIASNAAERATPSLPYQGVAARVELFAALWNTPTTSSNAAR